jgi:pimeloyl-ACP methyl ester carboxylesterase
MKSTFSILFVLAIIFSGSAKKEKGDWWFTKKARKSSVKAAHKAGLTDTLIKTSSATMFLFKTKKYDAAKPTMILIHGMGINGTTQWNKQMLDFSKKYNLIVPDLAGYDKSLQDAVDYSPDTQAQNIYEAVLKCNMGNKFHVAGFSYGGLIVATFKKMFPAAVLKVAICDSPVNFFTPRIADSIIKVRNLVHFSNLLSPETPEEVHQLFDAAVSGKKKRIPKFLLRKMCTHFFSINAVMKRGQMDFLSANFEAYIDLDYDLNNENVLLVWGTEDGAIPFIVGTRLHAKNPNAVWHPIVGAKHDASMNFVEEYNETLLEFFGRK